jgi:hypothetical protein
MGILACGKNYFSNSHTHEDFFSSLTTTASSAGLQSNIDCRHQSVQLFHLCGQGMAAALRPGDMLLFNPLYHHCQSGQQSQVEGGK